MPYRAPVTDYRFLMDHVSGFANVAQTERFAEATDDMTDAILGEAAKMTEEVIAPLQRNGDLHPAVLENGVVRTSPGLVKDIKPSLMKVGLVWRLHQTTAVWALMT